MEDEERQPYILSYTKGDDSFKVFRSFNGNPLPQIKEKEVVPVAVEMPMMVGEPDEEPEFTEPDKEDDVQIITIDAVFSLASEQSTL